MALIRVDPVETHVTWDRRALRPAWLHGHGHRLEVADVDRLRDERAAYPHGGSPRLTLVLRTTDGGRAEIAWDVRTRRWYLHALEAAAA